MNIQTLPDLAQIALFWGIVLGGGFGLAWLVNRMTRSSVASAKTQATAEPTPAPEASASTAAAPADR